MHSFTLLSAVAGASLALAKPLAAPAPAAAQITAAPVFNFGKAALERRQDDEPNAQQRQCMNKADAILDRAPDVNPGNDLVSWIQSKHEELDSATRILSASDICSVDFPKTMDAPSAIVTAWDAYTSTMNEWIQKIEPTVTSLAQSCGGHLSAAIEMMLMTDYDSCTSLYANYEAAISSAGFDGGSEESATETGSPAATRTTAAPTGGATQKPDQTGDDNEEEAGGNNEEAGDNAEPNTTASTAGAPRETGFVVAAAAAVVAVAGAVVAL